MATNEGPHSVPNVTLAVARGAASGGGGGDFTGTFLYKDDFSDYETDKATYDGSLLWFSDSQGPNRPILEANGWLSSQSQKAEPRLISEISQGIIAEQVTIPSHPKFPGTSQTVVRFRYDGNPDLTADSWTEFRVQAVDNFFCDQDGLSDIWVQYDLYIPANVHYRDTEQVVDPASGQFIDGHKWFQLWSDGYSGEYPTLVIGGKPRMIDYGTSLENTLYITTQMATKNQTTGNRRYARSSAQLADVPPLVRGDFDPGHWSRFTYRLAMESAEGAADGKLEIWVQRHVGEPDSYVEKLTDVHDFRNYDPIHRLLNGGYFMGWTNIGYNEEVNYLLQHWIAASDKTGIDEGAINNESLGHTTVLSGDWS